MADFLGTTWDFTKCLCGSATKQAAYVYDLEENLKSLEDKWKYLLSIKEDVVRKVEEGENTGEMQRTHLVDTWMKEVGGLEEVRNVNQILSYDLSLYDG